MPGHVWSKCWNLNDSLAHLAISGPVCSARGNFAAPRQTRLLEWAHPAYSPA
ncbi:hypothetical protein RBWH47_03662 [Rhodopirellula baltica WH47]|uniref:Uncharacterized protein n=2 Tax=Rhodopirellula baltica TaxID=265606 RepID=F2ARA4_RHOBT|nr:hypothetical protein RBWH47_03662 [Rhodopirellula baltica WH47]ELP35790.1 hypothetical protein RBSWK_00197 [Rhodopirellula baltica SWK14]